MKPRNFFCAHCQQEAWIQEETIYDGFTPRRTVLVCALCGAACPPEITAKTEADSPLVNLFGTLEKAPEIFSENEAKNLYRYCGSYVVNPFTQFCSHHKKEVEATDSCPAFTPRRNSENVDPF